MLGVAVIGAGHWGPNLIRNFHNRETSRVVHVVDRDARRLQEVHARFPDVATGDDAAVAMAAPEVDAVVVATPTSTHYELVRAALLQGKHVLVEKPITASAAQGDELCALAERQGRVLMVGHVFLYNPAVRRVREMLHAGEFGRVYYLSMVRTNLGPIRVDVDAAWDLASHDVSIVDHWLGATPTSVAATGGSWINPGIHDAVFATLRYPDEVVVNLHVSWLNPKKVRQATVVGERRMLVFDDMNIDEPLRLYDKQVTDERVLAPWVDTFASFRASVREGDIVIPRVRMGEPLRVECEHFIECVRSGQRPLTDGRAAVAVVRTLEAIGRSVAAGGRQEPV